MPPPLPPRLPSIVLFTTVSEPWQKTPPPLAVASSARLPLTVLPVRVRLPPLCTQMPPPPTALVLPRTVVSVTVVGPCTNSAPPPLPPAAALVTNALRDTEIVPLDVWTRIAPPSFVAVLSVNWQRCTSRLLEPRR